MKRNGIHLLLLLAAVFALLVSSCVGQPSPPTWQEQYDLGVRYLSEGNYQEAVIAFTAAIEIDSMRAAAYLGLANAHLADGDIDAAALALQRGYDQTGDETLLERMEQLRSDNSENAVSGGTVDLPLELTVLVRQEKREPAGWSESDGQAAWSGISQTVSHLSYNQDGYLIGTEDETQIIMEHDELFSYSFSMEYEYAPDYDYSRYRGLDSDLGSWSEWEEIDPVEERGMSSFMGGFVYCNPYSGVDRPERVDPIPLWGEDCPLLQGAYAIYEYDEAGNAVVITTYDNTGAEVGSCINTWAVLMLGSDGAYTLR